ncbi:MAG: hypothetical protein ACRC3B_21950, partial [Bacteroidia bacterium]
SGGGEVESFGAASTALGRASINVTVRVTTNSGSPQSQAIPLKIIGPGDVIGINADAVVRTEPRNWITNFEPNSFAFIDFYEEDFPWRYSPAKAAASDKKLRPWLTLVVLKENEFTRTTVAGALLNTIQLNPSTPTAWPLPKCDELWAWAHVSADETMDPNQTGSLNTIVANLNTSVNKDPNIAISRIICPRRLEENTSYYAFLIPTYETGRLAGLGETEATINTIQAQAPAWSPVPVPNPALNIQTIKTGAFPVYYEWYFRTGATGDFEYLVRQLQPRTLDQKIGRRPMDVQSPGYGLSYTSGDGTLSLEGALRTPNNAGAPYPYADSTFHNKLRDLINLGEDMINPASYTNPAFNDPVGGSTPIADPVIAPPLYGRWHSLRRTVDTFYTTYWTNELNLDPRNRVAAALGGDYVRKNQEWLMQKAWEQVGDVIAANNRINWTQLIMESGRAMHQKHIATQPDEQKVSITGRVMSKVKNGTVSVLQEALNSKLPEGAQSAAFRKLRRPTGVLMTRFDAPGIAFNNILTNMAAGNAAPVAAKTAPATAAVFTGNHLNILMSSVQAVTNPAVLNTFTISAPALPNLSQPATSQPNSSVTTGFQASLGAYNNVFASSNWIPPSAPAGFDMQGTSIALTNNVAPTTTLPVRLYDSLRFMKNSVVIPPPPSNTIVRAMAGPSFRMPMYKSLQELGMDFFIPNLDLIPQNTVTLLETNPKFIESFMVGANYEMARELLWREYPTDQRGTYFRHFWENSDQLNTSNMTPENFELSVRDITDIDTWANSTVLGTHSPRTAAPSLVLCLRGDFLKKFPNAVIYATQADPPLVAGGHRVKKNPEVRKYPLFSAKVDPDITFIGFDLTEAQAKGTNPVSSGWFFVITERPGDLRFGLDNNPTWNAATSKIRSWNDLCWQALNVAPGGHVGLGVTIPYATTTPPTPPFNPYLPVSTQSWTVPPPPVTWASDSAAMAMITYQTPAMMLVHASVMLP